MQTETETVELDTEELELEIEESNSSSGLSNGLSNGLSSGLSNDFYIDGFESNSGNLIEPVTVEPNYYSEDASTVIDSEGKVISSPAERKNSGSALDLLSREECLQLVHNSQVITNKKITLGLEKIKSKINFNDNVHLSSQLETLIKVSDKNGGGVKDIILNEIYKNSNLDPRELFERIRTSDNNNDAEYYVFKEQFDKIKSAHANEQYKYSYVNKMNIQATRLLLSKILDFEFLNRVFPLKGDCELLKKFYSTDGVVTHFKCEHCSGDVEYKSKINNFVYVLNIGGSDFSLVLPLVCDKCDGLSILYPKYLEKVLKDCSKISRELKTTNTGSNKFSYYRSVMDIGVYVPGDKELSTMLSKFNVEPIDLNEELEMSLDEDRSNTPVNQMAECREIEDDWENIVQRFFDIISNLGDSKFKLYSDSDYSSQFLVEQERDLFLNEFLPIESTNNVDSEVPSAVSSSTIEGPSIEKTEEDVKSMLKPSSNVGRKRYNFSDKHLKNVTKIFSTMYGNYPYLKPIAITSAINLLKPLGLNKFSLTSKSFYRVYSLFDNLNELSKKDLEFLSTELGYTIYNEDGSLDESISVNLFKDINYMNDNFEKEKVNFINSMYNNLYYLSYMPLSSSDRLSDEDINDYMYDEDIRLFVDRISDFMIMNSLAEEWLNGFNPAISGGSETMLVTYKRNILTAIKSMKSVNRKKPIMNYIDKICGTMFGKIYTLMSFVDSADSINYINQFLEACYNRDLYEMYRCSDKIVGNFKSSDLPEFMDLVQLLTLFPKKEIDVDKFSFYFPNLQCDNKYKARFVRLFERKGFVPKVLKGNNEEEKLLYYESLDYNTDKVDYMPEEIKNLLKSYDGLIRFGRFISYSNLFKDYAVYYSARDILFSILINKTPMNSILSALNLEPSLASMLIGDDYEMPRADEVVVEYIDLLNLPLDGTMDIEGVSQNDRISELLDSYDDLKSTFKSFPKVYDYVSNILKDAPSE